jgi:hypothetical protein
MTRNQKIALGCGGAGCLGLIVVAIAGGLIYFFARSATNGNYNFNVSTNRNSNTNDNSDLTSNSNDNDNSSNSSSSTSSSLSEDDQHKLYQAAMMTRDAELLRRVEVKLGLRDDDFTPGSRYEAFVTEHVGWSIRNLQFIGSLDTAEKARAYVNENFPE